MNSYITMLPELPHPPQEVIAASLALVQNSKSIFNAKYSDYENFNIYLADQIINNWVDQHIGPLFNGERYLAVVQTSEDSLMVHVDTNRTVVYNYILDCGGDNVSTYFTDIIDDNGNVVFETVLPKGVWHRLDASKPHGVKNLTSKRIAISVGNIVKLNKEAARQIRRHIKEHV